MHPQAYGYVRRVARGLDLSQSRVLEFGSYNVNGSVRPLFRDASEYIGVDIRSGPDVDVVADAAAVCGLGEFDVVVSCEVLEHAEDPGGIIAAAYRSLKPGGIFIVTAAGPDRAPHSVMGGEVRGEHYGNIDAAQLGLWLHGWERVKITQNRGAGDVYAVAYRPLEKRVVERG